MAATIGFLFRGKFFENLSLDYLITLLINSKNIFLDQLDLKLCFLFPLKAPSNSVESDGERERRVTREKGLRAESH